MERLVRGAIGGCLATVPMTLFMRLAHRHLPWREKYPLPPEQITTRTARAAGVEAHPEKPGWEWKTFAGHFSYGTAVGMLYGLIAPRGNSSPTQQVVRGSAYGLAVWVASYLGWLPALGILPPATREPARRNGLMIVAHLIWGSVLAAVVEGEARRRRPTPVRSVSVKRSRPRARAGG